jgi:undecaprenyl-diphosphatase
MSTVTYLEAIVIGALQGVSELFPVSSLGHSVLLPALIGGRWAADLNVTARHSPYLAVLVAMHVATALGMMVYFRSDWVRLIGALGRSLRTRAINTPDQRLCWLLVVATIPVGIAGLALAAPLQTVLGKPVPSAIFLAVNGLVLYAVERAQRRPTRTGEEPAGGSVAPAGQPARATEAVDEAHTVDFSAQETMVMTEMAAERAADRRLARLSVREAVVIGAAQSFALLPGISRSGITIVAGLQRGLRHGDAARFAFLLATPVILAAGVLKIPELFSAANRAVLGPALAGSLLAGIAAYLSVRFLTSYFESRTLKPFALYCVLVGLGSLAVFVVR